MDAEMTFDVTSYAGIARPDIRPAFAEHNLPIAVATDENYLPYLQVMVNSILSNTKNWNIDLLVLNDGLSADAKSDLISRFDDVQNISVRFIDVGDAVRSLNVDKYKQSSATHFTIAILYRLLLPYLLTSYAKVLYLDIDLCICGDIADLYNTDLGDCLLGGVYDCGVEGSLATRDGYLEWGKANGFTEWTEYINSGVIVMNLAAFRAEEGIFDRMLSIAIAGSDHFPDQDALNFVCKGRIKHLDLGWNAMALPNCIKNWLGKTDGDPKAFHYCGREKPWSNPEVMYSYLWWNNVSCKDGVKMWRKAFGDKKDITLGEGIAATVIMPIHNAEQFLAQTLFSCSAQTLRNIEIICVDDGSTDGSRAICERFAAFDPRIRVVSQSNQGAAIARNRGIAEASGRWLFFCDADDYSTPEMLAEMVAEGERKNADIVATGWDVIEWQNGYKWERGLPEEYFGFSGKINCHVPGLDIFNGMDLPAWNKLFNTRFVRQNGLEFHQIACCDDYFFVVASLIKADRIVFVPAAYYCYRANNPTSQLGTGHKNAIEYPRNLLRAFLDVKPLLEKEDECLQSKFYAACVANLFKCLFNIKAPQVKIAIFDLLKNGGLMELAFPTMDVDKVDLGEWRKPFDMILAGCDIFELMIERGRQGLAERDKQLERQRERYEREISALASSTAYRVGMFLTWPLRKVWGGIKCLREHGVKYTFLHAIGKVLRFFGLRVTW